jgi:hypothetical protein
MASGVLRPGKELFVLAHLGARAGAIVVILAIIRLVGYAINDDKRWRKFLFLVLLLMAAPRLGQERTFTEHAGALAAIAGSARVND